MKVPCRWLAEYVDIELERKAVERLAERLTLAGLEVEAITFTGRVHGAMVGRVLSSRPHPNSDTVAKSFQSLSENQYFDEYPHLQSLVLHSFETLFDTYLVIVVVLRVIVSVP